MSFMPEATICSIFDSAQGITWSVNSSEAMLITAPKNRDGANSDITLIPAALAAVIS